MGASNIGPYGSDTYVVIGGSRIDLAEFIGLIVGTTVRALKEAEEAKAENSENNYRFNY